MKSLVVLSACALLGFAAPAFAQNSSTSAQQEGLKNNGSVNGPDYNHAAQPGDRDTESGKAPKMNEGRASATDKTGMSGAIQTGGATKMNSDSGSTSK